MNIEMRPIDSVIPYPSNPRKNDRAVQNVAASIREFGFLQPIVVDVDGVVIVGHTRLKAARLLKLTEVPVSVAESLTPDQVRAYRLADNKTGELSDWDNDLLVEEIRKLSTANYELDVLGFPQDVLDRILQAPLAEGAIDPDEAVAVPQVRCQVGQVWACGSHRVYCADAGNYRQVLRATFTLRPRVGVLLAGPTDFDVIRMSPVDVLYVWEKSEASAEAGKLLKASPFEIRAQLTALCGAGDGEYTGGFRACWYAVRRGAKAWWTGDRKQSTVWEIAPGAFPVDLALRAIRNHGTDGGVVYSANEALGSSLVAAEMAHRVLVGIGRPDDCNVALARWEAFTGQEAVDVTPSAK